MNTARGLYTAYGIYIAKFLTPKWILRVYIMISRFLCECCCAPKVYYPDRWNIPRIQSSPLASWHERLVHIPSVWPLSLTLYTPPLSFSPSPYLCPRLCVYISASISLSLSLSLSHTHTLCVSHCLAFSFSVRLSPSPVSVSVCFSLSLSETQTERERWGGGREYSFMCRCIWLTL